MKKQEIEDIHFKLTKIAYENEKSLKGLQLLWCHYVYKRLLEDDRFWHTFDEFLFNFEKLYPDKLQEISLFNIIYWMILLEDEKYWMSQLIKEQMGQCSF